MDILRCILTWKEKGKTTFVLPEYGKICQPIYQINTNEYTKYIPNVVYFMEKDAQRDNFDSVSNDLYTNMFGNEGRE